MLVIVEGNEGAGKTTLINELAKTIPFVYVKYPKEIKNTSTMLENFAGMPYMFVLDRSFISDIVYRRLDHKTGQMTLFDIGCLCKVHENNIKIIFCHNKDAFKNAMKRGETNITVESIHKILDNEFYTIEEMLKNFTDIEIFDYDYEYQDVNDVIEFLQEKCQGGN